MNSRLAMFVLGTVATSFALPVCHADEAKLEETIVIRHPPLLVYFTKAPPDIKTSVLRMLRKYCTEAGNWSHPKGPEQQKPDAARQICAGARVTVMHGINYRNESNGSAFACLTELLEDDRVFPVYYEEYFNTRYRCVVLYRDIETNDYTVEPPQE